MIPGLTRGNASSKKNSDLQVVHKDVQCGLLFTSEENKNLHDGRRMAL